MVEDARQDEELQPEAEAPPTRPQIRDEAKHAPPASGPRQAYRGIRRELAEDDLKNPAVARLILGDRDRLEMENAELRLLSSRYHQADKEAAVLREKTRTVKSIEVSFAVALSLGSLLIGLSFRVSKMDWCTLLAGGILLIVGVVARAIKK